MALYTLQTSNLQPLDDGLRHIPRVNKDKRGGVSLNEFLDSVNVVV